MRLPFKESGTIRRFGRDVDEEELVWHRDREDRLVRVVGETDWKIQLDNKIPQEVHNVFIPKGVYHRLLKGSEDLVIEVIRLDG